VKFGKEYNDFLKTSIHQLDYANKGDWQKMYSEYLDRLFHLKGKQVLDFGCNLGSMASAMIDHAMDVIGIEIDQWYKDNCPFENMKERLHIWDGEHFVCSDQSCDFVHASQTLEHVPSDKLPQTFKEFFRILRPGGLVYFSVPSEGDNHHDPTHVSALSERAWIEHLLNAGFDVVTKEYEPQWKFEPMVLTHKWLQHVGRKPIQKE